MMISGRRCVTLSWSFCQLLGCLSAKSIVATVGKDVTLPCMYDAEDHGRHPACWGRGAVFLWDCADEVIKAGRTTVTSRLSRRYLLLGDLDKGDVSLTIRQLEESDSGVYSCRVEIPGWFNDHTHELTLMVVPAPPNPLKLETREVHKRTITVHWTPLFDGGRPITSYMIYMKHKLASWETAVINHVLNPDQTQSTFVGLHPAETYNFCMFASNSVGRSNASNVLTITTKEAAPEGPPLDIQLKALSSHSIQVTWKPPRADLRNGVLLGYSIGYREYDPANRQIEKWQYQSVRATREVESVMLNHLKPSTVYGVFIQARTNAGVGPVATDLCSTLSQATIESSFPLSPGATSELTESVEEGVPELFSVESLPTLEKMIDFTGEGNIVRMGVVASFIVILILVFIFRRRFLLKKSSQEDENIYDSVQRLEQHSALHEQQV
ncbi:Down syndrome cell adhesion molecule homolog [Mastacembelus armatus]|uniref:Down syndrome cell adhesion molecule homolog n=1 Tax=Mastacembelus armatus TaxID=205130 RepID=UPI000E455324|nr:Down syndrome cell adhesion molecule homolog [Mastacembelus armatus]